MRKFFSNPIRVALTFLLALVVFHGSLWAGHTFLEGFPAELCAKVQGFTITPFFMESFIGTFGLFAVLVINHFRRKWEGEELVYLEVVDDPKAELPLRSKSVILPHREQNEQPLQISLAAIEGAIDNNDLNQAKELILTLDQKDLTNPEVQALIKKLS